MQQQRRQHQAELARQKNEETARRLASGGLGSGDGQGPNKTTGDIIAYRNVDDIPARELKIHVSSIGLNRTILFMYGLCFSMIRRQQSWNPIQQIYLRSSMRNFLCVVKR